MSIRAPETLDDAITALRAAFPRSGATALAVHLIPELHRSFSEGAEHVTLGEIMNLARRAGMGQGDRIGPALNMLCSTRHPLLNPFGWDPEEGRLTREELSRRVTEDDLCDRTYLRYEPCHDNPILRTGHTPEAPHPG